MCQVLSELIPMNGKASIIFLNFEKRRYQKTARETGGF